MEMGEGERVWAEGSPRDEFWVILAGNRGWPGSCSLGERPG